LQTTRYTNRGWEEDAFSVVFLHRRQRPDTLAGTQAEAGLVRIGGRTRVVGEAVWALRPNDRTGVELIAAADLVETRRALEDGTAYTFAGASLERQLTPRLTVIGLGAVQHFTDSNDRTHARARLIWSVLPERGVHAQVRWRGFRSEQADAPRPYFDPERYGEWDAGIYVRRRVSGWVLYGAVAAGRESISGGGDRTTGFVEVRAEGPLRGRARLLFQALYDRSAGFAVADDYWYSSATVSVIVPVR
jgi:hypothetical protein